jgi:predicted nucleic acid-binding protein
MNLNYVIDTDVLIYHLNDCLGKDGEALLEKAFLNGVFISVITRIELLSWHKHVEKSTKATLELLNNITEHSLNEEIIQTCIDLRKRFRLKVPDAIIAATALTLGAPLITNNLSDYKKVPRLKLIDPFKRLPNA